MEEKSYWFVFCGKSVLVETDEKGVFCRIPLQRESPVDGETLHNLSPFENIACKAIRVPDNYSVDEKRYRFIDLRASYDYLPFPLYLIAGKASEILYWDKNNRYCGVCGTLLENHSDISKKCPACGKEIWPLVAVAIIVLVRKGDEILLVHAHNFRGNFQGLVAGFVETGETLEECVEREVWEETRINVHNIRYYGSQPWPYPCGLMVGFFADYVSGEITLQKSELSEGAWYHRDNLPEIPRKLSMARQLIDAWLEGRDK